MTDDKFPSKDDVKALAEISVLLEKDVDEVLTLCIQTGLSLAKGDSVLMNASVAVSRTVFAVNQVLSFFEAELGLQLNGSRVAADEHGNICHVNTAADRNNADMPARAIH